MISFFMVYSCQVVVSEEQETVKYQLVSTPNGCESLESI
jgi:hypothetical protein